MTTQLTFFNDDKLTEQIKELLNILRQVRNKDHLIHGKGWSNMSKALNLVEKIKLK